MIDFSYSFVKIIFYDYLCPRNLAIEQEVGQLLAVF